MGMVRVLMALVFVVASLGIVNTLTMNVLEQTREVGVLRAIGMKRGQVRKTVLCQAVGMGVVSLVPGLLLGTGLAYVITLSCYPLVGVAVDFRLDAAFIAQCCLAALTIAAVAALVPARRASRLEVVRALQYE
ncbi:MAG TPA: FtsX-like permease family protein [Gemmataceae bacterium]|nr:FtsX-like permease family protein [Gemmataceae bacterium]